MRRRVFLSLVVSLLSGCLSAARTDTSTRTATPESLPPTGDAALTEFDAGEPFETRRVGDPESDVGHRIVVWNDDADRRPIRVRLRPVGVDDAALDANPTFPAYGSLRVEVFRPADYVLEIRGPRGRHRTFGVRRAFVDCSDSATHVAIRPDGSIRGQVVSTAVACETRSDADTRSGSDTPTP
jgi:hypothetical protein